MDDRVAGVAGGKEHLECRKPQVRLVSELTPVETTRKPDVGEQQEDVRMFLQRTQCRRSVRGLQHTVTQVTEHRGAVGTDFGVIFDDQDNFSLTSTGNI